MAPTKSLGQKTFPEQLDDPSIFIASCGPFEIASNEYGIDHVYPGGQVHDSGLNPTSE